MNPPGISIVSQAPLWNPGGQAWHLTQQIHKYSHTIEALGGFWSAQFTIRGGRNLVDDWLQDGLGRHVEVFDHSTTCIWEGFVNKISANYGPLAVNRGPLLDIANRVSVAYTATMQDDDGNPIFGACASTADADDTDSQALWGIIPKILNTGGVELSDAEAIRDSYLENHKMPRTGKETRSDAESETSVTVDCLGYIHWLNYPYNAATTGTHTANTKIYAVLIASPNAAWFNFPTAAVTITANPLTVLAWEAEDNIAWAIIKDIVARGGTSQERWILGMYADRELYYDPAPTVAEYQQRLSQPRPIIQRPGGDQAPEVYPWNVLPGKWMMFPDFLIGQAAETNLRDDPRAMFIEQVKYTAPWDLQLRGGSVDTTSQLIAQLGLGGIGA